MPDSQRAVICGDGGGYRDIAQLRGYADTRLADGAGEKGEAGSADFRGGLRTYADFDGYDAGNHPGGSGRQADSFTRRNVCRNRGESGTYDKIHDESISAICDG